MKISRALVQRYLISYSWSWTGLPGRLPRTEAPKTERRQPGLRDGGRTSERARAGCAPSSRRSMTESRSTSFPASAIV